MNRKPVSTIFAISSLTMILIVFFVVKFINDTSTIPYENNSRQLANQAIPQPVATDSVNQVARSSVVPRATQTPLIHIQNGPSIAHVPSSIPTAKINGPDNQVEDIKYRNEFKTNSIYGEPISHRIEKYLNSAPFPFAATITLPINRIIADIDHSPVDNEALTSIMNDAFDKFYNGENMAGFYTDNDKNLNISWRLERIDINMIDNRVNPETKVDSNLTSEYRLYIGGEAGDEAFADHLFAVIRTNQDATFTDSSYFSTDGKLIWENMKQQDNREEAISWLKEYENGVQVAKLRAGIK